VARWHLVLLVCFRLFRLTVPYSGNPNPVSTPPHRTQGAYFRRTRHQTFVHGRSFPVSQAVVRVRITLPEYRLSQTEHSRHYHRLRCWLPEFIPGSSFTSVCGTFLSSCILTAFTRISLATSSSDFEPRPVPSRPALPGFNGTTGLSATSLAVTGNWLIVTRDHMGCPCCLRFPCVHAAATTPVQRLGACLRSLPQTHQPSPIWLPGRPAHCPFRGLLGVHSRCGLRHLVTPYIEGFSHFVTSMTAPIASDWSKSCRAGLSPTGKRRLSTAHAKS